MSERIAVNKPVGIDSNGDIYIASDFFKYGDGFQGVTGDVIVPVTVAMIDDALEIDSKAEWAEDIWREDAGSANGTELGLEDWTNKIPDDEYLDMVYDPADVDVEALNALIGIDAERYAVIGCGRVFGSEIEWSRVFDVDLLARITEWEN